MSAKQTRSCIVLECFQYYIRKKFPMEKFHSESFQENIDSLIYKVSVLSLLRHHLRNLQDIFHLKPFISVYGIVCY